MQNPKSEIRSSKECRTKNDAGRARCPQRAAVWNERVLIHEDGAQGLTLHTFDLRHSLYILALLLTALLQPPVTSAQSAAFTYQGHLNDGGVPANGSYDLRLVLHGDAVLPGFEVGQPQTNSAVAISNGLFTTVINFGLIFDQQPRWLEIGVRPAGSTNDFTTLAPRQPITAAPKADFANRARTLDAPVAESLLPSVALRRYVNENITGLFSFTSLLGNPPFTVNSDVLVNNFNADKLDGFDSGAFWKTTGNASTIPGTHFLGTTDNQPLMLQGSFVGIGRTTPITGAEYFGVNAPVTAGSYGGMYINTTPANGLPFYGYAQAGGGAAWHYLDGSDGNKWKLFNNGNHLTVTPTGNIGVGTTSPTAKLHVNGTPGTDGIRFPDGSLQTTAPKSASNNGFGYLVTSTNAFLSPTVILTINSTSQSVLVTSHKAFGSISPGGASGLGINIGYRISGSTAEPTGAIGGGILDNRVTANTRVVMGLSWVFTGLAPGTYEFGMTGYSPDFANWNNNEWGYTTALIH